MLLEILCLCLIIQVNTRLFSKNEAITILSSLEQTSPRQLIFQKIFHPGHSQSFKSQGQNVLCHQCFSYQRKKEFLPFECQGRIYTSFNGHLRDHKCFSRTTTGVYIRPLVVRIINTWSLYMLHGDVYIRPWLLMPKQRGIQRVNLLIHPIIHSFCQETNRMFLFMS